MNTKQDEPTPEPEVEKWICLFSFLALDRDRQIVIFPQPYNRIAVSNFLIFTLGALSNIPFAIAVFDTEEASYLSRLICRNLEFLIEREELKLTILLPKGADVDGYFIWDNIRYMSRHLIELQDWKESSDNDLISYFERMQF